MLNFKLLLFLILIRIINSSNPTASPSSIRSNLNRISLLAGTGSASSSGTGGPATSASIYNPMCVWSDTAGFIFFAEYTGHCVRKFSTSISIVTNVAGVCGGSGTYNADNIPATSATLSAGYVFGNSVGGIYVSDSGNNRVRKVISSVISTYAGTGTAGTATTGNGGSATSAQLYAPTSLFVDTSDRLYIGSYSGCQIRTVDSGIIYGVAGTGSGGLLGIGGPATSAQISHVEIVFIDTTNTLYFSDSGGGISKLLGAYGGTGYAGENIPISSATLDYPSGIAVDSSNGDLYLSSGQRVLVATKTTSLLSTFAGNGSPSSGGDGGDATSASIYIPDALMLKGDGSTLYIAEYAGNRLRVVYSVMPTVSPTVTPSCLPSVFPSLTPSTVPTVSSSPTFSLVPTAAPSSSRSTLNKITTLAGTGPATSSGTAGQATAASLNGPLGIWYDSSGFVYVSERAGSCVRKFSVSLNIMTAVAGVCNGPNTYTLDNIAATAAFMNPWYVAVNTLGYVYVGDTTNNRVRKIVSGVVTTVAGTGSPGTTGNGGVATSAQVYAPTVVFADTLDGLYIGSYDGFQVRYLRNGVINAFAGTGTIGYSGMGGPASSALINHIESLTQDTSGQVYISDSGIHRIYKVSSGIITSFLGTGTSALADENAAATSASLCYPIGMTVDSGNGDMYIALNACSRIQVVTKSVGLISTFAGGGSSSGDGGDATAASLANPCDVKLKGDGSTLFFADIGVNKVRSVYSVMPTMCPSTAPTLMPSVKPSIMPSITPSILPSIQPSILPSVLPSVIPTVVPTAPTVTPTSIRSTQNKINLLGGTGTASSTGTGGPATSASINNPTQIWSDSTTYLYFSERGGNCIRKFSTANNIVVNVAGVCGTVYTFSGDSMQATSSFLAACSVYGNTAADIYIADNANNRVRKVSSGVISTVAGNGGAGTSTSGNGGVATSANLYSPVAVVLDSVGALYVGSYDSCLVRVVSGGTINAFAGIGSGGYGGFGGPATSAQFRTLEAIGADTAGVIYFTDSTDAFVLSVSGGILTKIIGTGTSAYAGENVPVSSASIAHPLGVSVDSGNGDLYVGGDAYYRVSVITKSTSRISTFAGNGAASTSGDGGYATAASILTPFGVTVKGDGSTVYITEYSGHRLRIVYSVMPTVTPTLQPIPPTVSPTIAPSVVPSILPSIKPSLTPSTCPTVLPSLSPSVSPSAQPSLLPSLVPTAFPSALPTSPTTSPSTVRSTLNRITTLAGSGSGTVTSTGTGGPATSATMYQPSGVWSDTTTYVYFTERGGNCIRKFSTTNNIVVNVGSICGISPGTYNGDNIPATSAIFSACSLFGSSAGDIYVADCGNNRIRKISTGSISTVMGTGGSSNIGNGGAATSAEFNYPNTVILDTSNNLYVGSYTAFQVRVVALGYINAFAGSGTSGYSGFGGAATNAKFQTVEGIGADTTGVVYIGDAGDGAVFSVFGGILTKVIGTGTSAYAGENMPISSASIRHPMGIGVDSNNGDLYINSDESHRVNVITKSTSRISTFAGNGSPLTTGDLGDATAASINTPFGIMVKSDGSTIYLAEYGGNRIRMIYSVMPTFGPTLAPSCIPTATPTSARSSQNNIATIAGTGAPSVSSAGGLASATTVQNPVGVWMDSLGYIYYSESFTCIRKFLPPTNIVINVAGTCGGSTLYNGDNMAATSTLFYPYYLSGNSAGTLYVADASNNRVRKIVAGVITTVAGVGTSAPASSGNNGAATAAQITAPSLALVDTSERLYISSFSGSFVRLVQSGIIAALIGTGSAGSPSAGVAASSVPIRNPECGMFDSSGNYCFSDSGSQLSNLMGTGSASFSGENSPTSASSLNYPTGLALDTSNGDIYVAIHVGARVSVATKTTGIMSTFAGTGSSGYSGDDGAATSGSINHPLQLYLATANNLYFAEQAGNRVRMVFASSPTQAPSVSPSTTKPSVVPTLSPTSLPTLTPSNAPSVIPSVSPTALPTLNPTLLPTCLPTIGPSILPSTMPSICPTLSPSLSPSINPTSFPTTNPTLIPTVSPTVGPSLSPSLLPTAVPSVLPSVIPTTQPSMGPSVSPSQLPSFAPTTIPSVLPSLLPSVTPTNAPSVCPSLSPTLLPSRLPTCIPTVVPTVAPTLLPTNNPSVVPSVGPSVMPTVLPSTIPSIPPSIVTSAPPTLMPSLAPSVLPSVKPSLLPSQCPSITPSLTPTIVPSTALPTTDFISDVPTVTPSLVPSVVPSAVPSNGPSDIPTVCPSLLPSALPTIQPSAAPTVGPTLFPSVLPTLVPSMNPTCDPTTLPSQMPTLLPTDNPTEAPSLSPTLRPSQFPTVSPTAQPSVLPTAAPSKGPSQRPTLMPSAAPSVSPTVVPTYYPSEQPSAPPTVIPTVMPTLLPSKPPTAEPSLSPTVNPSVIPTLGPSLLPSATPTAFPSVRPSCYPSVLPSTEPSLYPSLSPSRLPSCLPSEVPSIFPSLMPTACPTVAPSLGPSASPSKIPTLNPTVTPSVTPTTFIPSVIPTTVTPTQTPSTLEYYATHPKATLPSNESISVIGSLGQTFKIVIPFLTVASGSVGSAFSDVVLSSQGFGLAYLLTGMPTSTLSPVSSVSQLTMFSPMSSFDTAKRSVSVIHDINGDGLSDVLIGDPFLARCYILFGTASLTNLTSGFTIFGEQSSDLTGWSVSGAGDVNNDTLSDILIGAPYANSVGSFYVIFGRKGIYFDVYLNNLTASQGFAVYGATKSDFLGISVSAAGDVNKDGVDDVVVGAVVTASFCAGAAFILFGGVALNTVPSVALLTPLQGFKAYGSSYSYVGYSVSGVGDMNKDGFDDVLIGSSPQKSGVGSAAYMMYGASNFHADVLLNAALSPQYVRISGSGDIVSGVGDVNSDGFPDALIGNGLPLSSTVGLIIFTNVSDLQRVTASPSFTPTVSPLSSRPPTVRPTFVTLAPTFKPTVTPTLLPSGKPTTPTQEPTVGASQPSESPSMAPSQPTASPSLAPTEPPTALPSLEPTVHPSAVPSEAPSALPSEFPSMSPSTMPSCTPTVSPSSAGPTVPSLTRAPFAAPTVTPTIQSTIVEYVPYYISSEDSNITSMEPNVNFIVNNTGHVTIASGGLFQKYTVIPNGNSTLTITHFNKSCDLIDLTAFIGISQFSQLVVTEGSVVITLPNAQVIHILNLHPSDMSDSNFIFWLSPSIPGLSKTVKALSIVAGAFVALGGFILLICCSQRLYLMRVHRIAIKQLKAKNHFLMTINDADVNVEGSVERDDSVNLSDHSIDSEGEWFEKRNESDEELSQHSINSDGEWVRKLDSVAASSEPSMLSHEWRKEENAPFDVESQHRNVSFDDNWHHHDFERTHQEEWYNTDLDTFYRPYNQNIQSELPFDHLFSDTDCYHHGPEFQDPFDIAQDFNSRRLPDPV